ncbi:MAG: tetratricopeptide repeat protein [Burkholderiales bacterium]
MSDDAQLRFYLEAGLQAHGQGNLEGAETAFGRAIAIAPNHPDALNLYGVTLLQLGQSSVALAHLHHASRLQRNNPAVLGNLAQAYFILKRYDEARETFRKAGRLDPRAVQFPLGVANCFALQGKFDAAAEILQRLAARFPHSALVWFNLGNVQRDRQLAAEALTAYRKAIALDPHGVEARNNLAGVLQATLQFEEAEREFRECIRAAPEYLLARCNLASVVMDLGRFDEAAAFCRDIIRLAPELPLAHSFLGAALSHQGRLLDALTSHASAARLSPGDAKIAQTYAATLTDSGRIGEGLDWFARALALKPDLESTHQLLASALLGHGCLNAGWAQYGYRPWPRMFRNEHPHIALAKSLPADLAGKHICVMREQGLGDEIFFLRFAPQMHAAGARVTYCATRKISSLLARAPGLDAVLDEITPPPDTDTVILAGDLPHALGALPASTLPATDNFVTAATNWHPPLRISAYWPAVPPPLPLVPLANRLEEMRAHLAKVGPGPYLGLTWRGGTPPREQRAVIWVLYKEIGIAPLAAALRDVPGTFIGLQRNATPGEFDELSTALGRRVHDFSDLNEDLEGMLALLALIDDYIGVSNTNMHLRAGVGKTARVLVPSPPDWRWMMNNAPRSPWFPDFSIYRQSLNGDWSAALRELKANLAQ